MPLRFLVPAAAVILLAALLAVTPTGAQQQQIYRDGFAGRAPSFVRGDANIKFEEKDHALSKEHFKSGPTAEFIKIEANPQAGAQDAEFVHYYYATPPAPITDALTAVVNVKAFRPGIQVKARVVLPKEKDPRNPDAALTTLLPGKKYDRPRQWQPLGFGNLEDELKKHLPVLHARLGRAVDVSGAYVDRIVLNVYAGPGVTEVWVDDLEIGPVRTDVQPPAPKTAALASNPKNPKPRRVEAAEGQILVEADDGELDPFFMLAIRHSGTPLKVLRDAQFNTVWFPNGATPAGIEEAIRHGFWVVPTLPLPGSEWDGRQPKRPDPAAVERDAKALGEYLRTFLSTDAVLMWDFGSGRTAEDVSRVARAAEVVRTVDPRRPRSVDLWDGFATYSSYVTAVGAHRWPLFSSLELTMYRDWLAQRKALTPPGKMTWTWIQTHPPEWYVQLLTGRPDTCEFDHPIGPHPEQIRILTYLALAAGHRGLGFWSDKFLENPAHGRDRLLELALLNAEIEMLKPVLTASQDSAVWTATSNPNVQAAVMRGGTEILVLPVWLGAGTQYTPAQGVVPKLTIKVPAVPDVATPWLITPAGIVDLKSTAIKQEGGGTEITITEFDTACAVVFTSDNRLPGKLVRWQDHTKYRMGELAAKWAQMQAVEQFNKALDTHQRIIAAGGPEVPEAHNLFAESRHHQKLAQDYFSNKQFDIAYKEARRALRGVRSLMREDWDNAVKPFDTPTASPYAVNVHSLPEHWRFAGELASARPGGNGFAHGGFELSKPAPAEGASVTSLPGWEVRKLVLDPATAVAAIVNAGGLKDPEPQPPAYDSSRFGPGRVAPQPLDYRRPEAGQHCLKLSINPKAQKDRNNNPLPPPQAVERTVVAVDSPPAEFAPGSLVRVSFWVKVPGPIQASADGLIVFDSAGGEPLGVRVIHCPKWKQYHLYRRVPADGKVAMTFALTGLGTAFIDDVRIEPMIPFTAAGADVKSR